MGRKRGKKGPHAPKGKGDEPKQPSTMVPEESKDVKGQPGPSTVLHKVPCQPEPRPKVHSTPTESAMWAEQVSDDDPSGGTASVSDSFSSAGPEPSPVTDKHQHSTLESMAKLSIVQAAPTTKGKFQMAPRQPKGKLGNKINLYANYLLLTYDKNISVYHYDVDIIPKKGRSLLKEGATAKADAKKNISHVEHQQKRAPGKQKCRKVLSEVITNEKLSEFNPVYDGQKNIYTTRMLPIPDEGKTFKISFEEEGTKNEFEVKIKPVEKKGGGNLISLEPMNAFLVGRGKEVPQEVIMAFDTVMCHRNPLPDRSPLRQMQVGRSFFLFSENRDSLGEGLEIWYGYNQSIHLTQQGPAVVVNFAAKAFHLSANVLDVATEILGSDVTKIPKLSAQQIDKLEECLKKLKVKVQHQKNRRKYTIQDIEYTSAKDTFFKLDNGTEVSVADHFRQNYKPLQFPHLPVLNMGLSKKVFMPMEVCHVIAGQPKLGKLDGEMTSAMIKKTAIDPEDRFEKIKEKANIIEQVSGQLMSEFGLLLKLKFMELQGRVLRPPKLAYKSTGSGPSQASPDERGTWRVDGKEFYKTKSEGCSWMVLSFSNVYQNNLDLFAETLASSARCLGMNLGRLIEVKIVPRNVDTYSALKCAKDQKAHFVVVVLSPNEKNERSYDEIKFLAEVKLNLLTQCMTDKVVRDKFNPRIEKNKSLQVAYNVMLKINSKLGGVNHTLVQQPVVFSKPIIVIGADAAHSPRGFECPSIAAVVGSLDFYPFRYALTCRVQEYDDENKFAQEIIIELEAMVREILRAFRENTLGKKPEKILFFRDGVSEGQFSIVLEEEVPAIRRACEKELDGNVPPLTFIVVQKRHQTRFMPQNPEADGIGRRSKFPPYKKKPGNVPPGTTVDTDVVHPLFFDFFLCSHEGIQGTSKPAHYTVLLNDSELSSDELQKICYHLCYMYVRCNRSISVPAPIMYADLACTRAKKYADWYFASPGKDKFGEKRKLPPDIIKNITDMSKFEYGMFYV